MAVEVCPENPGKTHEQRVAELQQKHGDILCASARKGRCYFRKPTQMEHERWVEKMTGDAPIKTVATREYALACMVWPDRDAGRAILEDAPALPGKLAGALAGMAGNDVELELKKA